MVNKATDKIYPCKKINAVNEWIIICSTLVIAIWAKSSKEYFSDNGSVLGHHIFQCNYAFYENLFNKQTNI